MRLFYVTTCLFVSLFIFQCKHTSVTEKSETLAEASLPKELPNRIFIKVTPEDLPFVSEKGKGDRYEFTGAKFKLNDGKWMDMELKTRGQTCLKAPRRCFGVKLSDKVSFSPYVAEPVKDVKKFNLVSMWQDRGYINYKVGYHFLTGLGLFHLKNQYAELIINDKSYGLYLVVEKPDKVLTKRLNSPFVLRRGYLGKPTVKEFKDKKTEYQESDFLAAYEEIYDQLKAYQGPELYGFLSKRLNIEQYFEWLALNTFLKNGDYADEVFFYAAPDNTEERIYFNIMAWDYDDLLNKPHASYWMWSFWNPVNRKILKTKLIYSTEDKLDRRIAKDPYLYEKYTAAFERLLREKILDSHIRKIFQKVKQEIAPYLQRQRIIDMSSLDDQAEPYSPEGIIQFLDEMSEFLIKRRVEILTKIEKGDDEEESDQSLQKQVQRKLGGN